MDSLRKQARTLGVKTTKSAGVGKRKYKSEAELRRDVNKAKDAKKVTSTRSSPVKKVTTTKKVVVKPRTAKMVKTTKP